MLIPHPAKDERQSGIAKNGELDVFLDMTSFLTNIENDGRSHHLEGLCAKDLILEVVSEHCFDVGDVTVDRGHVCCRCLCSGFEGVRLVSIVQDGKVEKASTFRCW
jgi:hypothetical protein